MNLSNELQYLPSVCPLDCPDTCSLRVGVKDGKVIEIKGSSANPYTDSVICNKVARSYPEFAHGKNRLTHPLERIGPRGSGQFKRIPWEGALDRIASEFKKAINTHGPQSIMPFNYSGPHGELAGGSMDRRFFYRLGATQLNRSPLCGAVRGSAYSSLFGEVPGMPPEQASHADLIVVWGNNVTVSNLHFARVLKAARTNGSKVVIIDPKRIKIAEQCELHLQIRPGTDVVLALALAAELERRDALNLAFIEQWTVGAKQYLANARQYTIRDVESECGIPASQFSMLVDWYISANTIATSIGNGIERGRNGGSGLRAAMALQALTGQHGQLGAGVIAKSGLAAPKSSDRLQRPDLIPDGTRTFNLVDVPEKLLDKNLRPPVMATLIYNHNPVATHPDQANMIKALMREDLFIAGCDVAMTDSMAMADIVLPAATHFEHADLFAAYGQNYLQRSEAVIPAFSEALPNTEIFRRLAAKFGFNEAIFVATDTELMDDAMSGADPCFQNVPPSRIRTDQATELKGPNGTDLIVCKTVMPATPSGKIELFSQDLEERFDCGLPRYERAEQDLPLVLISPSSAKRTNATFGGCEASQGLEVLEMHPTDAGARSLTNGDEVVVWNSRGRVKLRLVVTDATRSGVVYSAKGTWRATSDTGQTVNALIPSDIRADIEYGACYNETFVDVQACEPVSN